MAAHGHLLTTTVDAGVARVTSYAVETTDGGTNVVVLNKQTDTTLRATVHLGASASTLSLLRMAVGDVEASDAGVSIGEAHVLPDGTWSPSPLITEPLTSSEVVVELAPASAVLIRAR